VRRGLKLRQHTFEAVVGAGFRDRIGAAHVGARIGFKIAYVNDKGEVFPIHGRNHAVELDLGLLRIASVADGGKLKGLGKPLSCSEGHGHGQDEHGHNRGSPAHHCKSRHRSRPCSRWFYIARARTTLG
jgi:hypothetical protein